MSLSNAQFAACSLMFLTVMLTNGCGSSAAIPQAYKLQVAPILENRCYQCHSDSASTGIVPKGGVRLDSIEWLRKGAVSGDDPGPIIVPGNPDESRLYRMLMLKENDDNCPPRGPLLSPAESAAIEEWIIDGAQPVY